MIEDVLAMHFEAYPQMQPQDAVKLIYQQEFGPRHLIKSPEKAMAHLKGEMASLKAKEGEPLYESIGNGLCRLNLRPCVERGIPTEDIFNLMMEAAKGTEGDSRNFAMALRSLERMSENDETPFDFMALSLFLASYRDQGKGKKPALLSHSPIYQKAYAPAYRVVIQKKLKDYLKKRRKMEQMDRQEKED